MQNQIIEGFQLSPQQTHLWSLCGRYGATLYRSQCAVRIDGRLDKRLLRRAIESVVQRHEILRTSFHSVPGMNVPVQVINEPSAVTIFEVNLSAFDASRQTAELEALMECATRWLADCEHGSMFHVVIISLSRHCHMLQLTLPALCADAAGLARLVHLIANAYEACVNEEELGEEPIQYADLSEWQNELLEADDAAAAREFWRKQDLSTVHNLTLPAEKQPVPDAGFDPQSFSVAIDSATAGSLAAIAGDQEVTMPILLLTCWQVLLWRLGGESDTIVCAAFDGRKFSELEQALGLFAKYLPVVAPLEKRFSFNEALQQTASAVRDVSKWQEVFTWEAEPRLGSFSFDFTVRPANLRASGVVFEIEKQCSYIDRFHVRLSCLQDAKGLSLTFHYDANRYGQGDVRRLAAQYQRLLESVIARPESPIADLEIVDDVERRRLLIDFNDTEESYALDKCLHQLFEQQAALTPGNVAVIFDGQQLTYAELNSRANQLAHHLQRLGIGPEDLVGICVERSLEMILGLLGILKAGAAYVPLDPSYPKERLALMLNDAGVHLLLTQQRLLETLPEHEAHVVCLDNADIVAESDENPRSNVSTANLAYVIYTSGSTGRPKGVMVPHQSIANRVLWMQSAFPLTGEDLVLQKTPFSFDASVWEFFAPLLAGARLLIARPGGHQDNAYLVDVVAREKVTTLQLVPSMFRVLLETKGIEACNSGLRRVFCGGEALPAAVQEKSFATLTADLHNLYGPTETAIDAAFWKCRTGSGGVTVPIGCPIGNMQIYLLDRDMKLVPVGVAGELYIGGVGVSRGYLNRPDLTADRFVPDPFSTKPGARLYRSGDLARYQASGVIEFLGRLDEQVKLRGFRIELGEIEASLREHPALVEAVVIASEQAPDDQRLVAYIVMNSGSTVTPNELRDFLRQKLPEYMVPTSFVVLSALPLMPNGKVDRRAIASIVETESRHDKILALPRDNLEGQLVRIWKQVLGTQEHIGVTDNFFDLGGHSLLAVGLMAQIQKWFGQELPLSLLFEGATIAHLAEVLRGQAAVQAPTPIVPIQPKGSRPPFFCVHTGSGEVLCYEPWARYLDADQPFYGVQDHFAYKDGDPEISIEEMASIYVDAVRATQPVGPYLLGGWSFGGLVAFEMARQLVELGQDVPLLVLVDAGSPAFLKQIIEADDAVLLTILANQLTRYSMKDEELRPLTEALRKLDTNEQLKYVIDYFIERDRVGANLDMGYAFDFLKRHLRVFRTRIQVTRRYDPPVYSGHITVFRGSEEPPEVRGLDSTKGWNQLSTQPVEVHIVPGNHETMGLEPNVKLLSARLQACIDEARIGVAVC